MKIGIIAAMSCEIDLLKAALTEPLIEKHAWTEFCSGHIGGNDVVFTQCGIGKVSAAAAVQAMITAYRPDYVINTGCAGALAKELAVGDIVVADRTVEWDIDICALGYPRGFVDALGQVEMLTDSVLSDKIVNAIGSDTKVVRGLIASGDQFISSPAQRETILSAFPDALCAEMEGAAIGHVCAQNGVPFAIIRCMSDSANGDSSVDFPTFAAKAGAKSAACMLKLLNEPWQPRCPHAHAHKQ